MNVHRDEEVGELAKAAAKYLKADLNKRFNHQDFYTLALSGGSTPRIFLQELTKIHLPWDKVHLLQVDERVAPDGSQDRNLTQILELAEKVTIPRENIHPMPVHSESLEKAADEYEDIINSLGGKIDMVHLGLGDDGHTASLAPNNPILGVLDRDVWYVRQYNGFDRLSLTYPAINRSKKILWLIVGKGKAEALRLLMDGDGSIPASKVKRTGAQFFIDKQASSLL